MFGLIGPFAAAVTGRSLHITWGAVGVIGIGSMALGRVAGAVAHTVVSSAAAAVSRGGHGARSGKSDTLETKSRL